jgi:hypothetical protein
VPVTRQHAVSMHCAQCFDAPLSNGKSTQKAILFFRTVSKRVMRT